VLQQGEPLKIQRAPRNARVADLVGIQNRFRGQWLGSDPAHPGQGRLLWLPDPGHLSEAGAGPVLPVADKGRIAPGQAVHWVMPSDGLLCLPEVQDPATDHPATVVEVRHLGDTSWVLLQLLGGTGSRLHLTLSGPQRLRFEAGAALAVRLDLALVHVMPTRENPL
jgi:molybdate transport system ATP-binding protein